jgi:hypothetical protein
VERRIWVAAFATLLLFACSAATSLAPGEPNVRPFCVQRPGDAEAICYVSFVQLLAHPERFHGKQIQVIGYMSLREEDHALYLSNELADHGASQDAFWLDVTGEPDVETGWVVVRGRFNAERRGHLGLYAGTIGQIVRLERWEERQR